MSKKQFERIYEDVSIFGRYNNAKGVNQLIERENYDRIVDLLKELSEENEQLKQHNTELINKIDFLERVIDGDME